MCGIAGALFPSSGDPFAAVGAMCQSMRKRGPDSAGSWSDPAGGGVLGHRRLSVIDLDARADQPMTSHDGRYVIVFNGEIYNYRQLRAALEKSGTRLKTEGDTEVVLELFCKHGADVLKSLRGMFAFAIWDREQRKFFLARDPYGIKPLYIAISPFGPLFASQVKALVATNAISRQRDLAGIAGFYVWGSVPEPFTTYRDIQAVPAGSFVVLDENGPGTPVTYADLSGAWRPTREPEGDMADLVRGAMQDSVRAHLVSDVPVAVLLSGGIDSSAIAGLMAEQGTQIEGITVTFDEFEGKREDEGPRARTVAEHFGLKNTLRRVNRNEFEQDLPAIFDAMDQPSVDGVNTWFASKAVAERGYKVVLSGVGGDELFAGYDTFRSVPRLHGIGKRLPSGGARRVVGGLASLASRLLNQPKLGGIQDYAATVGGAYMMRRCMMLPSEIGRLMGPEQAREGLRRLRGIHPPEDLAHGIEAYPLIAQVAALESVQYLRNQLLRDSDWASMAHSLELRTPLVDWKLAQTIGPHIASVALAGGKRLLANAPSRPIPIGVASARKTGFGLPLDAWLERLDLDGRSAGGVEKRWARTWSRTIAREFGISASAL